MHAIYEVFGLIEDPDEAEATVQDLVNHGVPRNEFELIEAKPGLYRIADEHLVGDVMGAGRGAAVGGLLGLALGLLVVWAVPDLGVADGAQWALGAFFFGVMGAFVGAMTGLQQHEELDDDDVIDRRIPQGSASRILAVRSDRWHARAHRIMERHRVIFLDEALPHG